MIVVGLILLGLSLVGFASHALDPHERESPSLDAILFLLCLIGVIHARKRDEDVD